MFAFRRSHRVDMHDLRVGDVIRYKAVYQSRSGMVLRARMRGRIEMLVGREAGPDSSPAAVEGELRDRIGRVWSFRLTETERVYRYYRAVGELAQHRPASVRNGTVSGDPSVDQAG